MADQTNAVQTAQQDHIEALRDLRNGVSMDLHNLDDGAAKLAALDAAIEVLSKPRAPAVDAQQIRDWLDRSKVPGRTYLYLIKPREIDAALKSPPAKEGLAGPAIKEAADPGKGKGA